MSSKTAKQVIQDAIPPKRIYNWLQSQLSIARYYGGITLNGVTYAIRYDLEGQPLEEVVAKKIKRTPRKKKAETKEASDELTLEL